MVRGGNVPDRSELHLEGANLKQTHLKSASLFGADLERAIFVGAHLEGADLSFAHLDRTNFSMARLEHARLDQAHAVRANFWGAHLEGASLQAAHLEGSYTVQASFSRLSRLHNAHLNFASLDQADLQATNLAVLDWTEVNQLGDEAIARQTEDSEGRPKDAKTRLTVFQAAIRANRQLAMLLRGQGMNTEADHFAFRAQLCQGQVYRYQGKHLQQFGSFLLNLVSRYGYRPLRSVVAYILVIGFFTGLYLLNAQFAAPHLTWDEALVLSISSFHGRGFFSTDITLGNNLARIAAGEAIIGLLLEITFIATFTQQFFAR